MVRPVREAFSSSSNSAEFFISDFMSAFSSHLAFCIEARADASLLPLMAGPSVGWCLMMSL